MSLRVFFVLAAFFAGCSGQEPEPGAIGPSEGRAALAAEISALVASEMEAKRIPAMAVALTEGERIVWARGFGEAKPGVAADVDTLFRVGSVSKLFTDIAVMARVEAGELDLDAPVREALPDFAPPGGDTITLRQLMAHRSGLVREPPVGNYFDDSRPSLAATVASLNQRELIFPPGAREKYSNAGIAVVGRVLERAAGIPFAQAVREATLEPLGLESSWFGLDEAPAERLATGLMWSYDGREFPAPVFPLGMAPAGSMVASVRDLGRFLTLLASGELPGVLSAEGLGEMGRIQFPDENPERGFGLGFHLGAMEAGGESHRVLRHGGAIYGFSTEIALLPDAGVGAVVVSNVDFTNAVAGRILRRMLQLALDPASAADPLTRPLPEELAFRLAGRYEGERGSSVRLLARSGRVEAELASATLELRALDEPGALFADSRRAFGPKLRFVDGGGPVPEIRIGSGEGTLYRRVDDPPPPPPPAAFVPLIGEYGPDHNILFVFEEDGELAVLIEWLERYRMARTDDPDWFAFPDRGLYPGESLRFVRDDDGGVTGVELSGFFFARRPGPTEGVFRIEPLLPVAELRRIAEAASMPEEPGDFLPSDLVRVTDVDPEIRLDVRYATTDNFMGAAFYEVADVFLQRPAAEALRRANRVLREHGYVIVAYDGYRPWQVTRMFWDATPEHQRLFVADPEDGSRHNRGAAVDIGLVHLESGEPASFVSGYDEFSERAFPGYVGGTSEQRHRRELLRRVMEGEGFTVYENEWWHFDFDGWERYPIEDRLLRDIP